MRLSKQSRFNDPLPPRPLVLAIGVILIVANCYWIALGRATDQSYTTNISLYFNVIFSLFLLVLANLGLREFRPRSAFRQGEILVIYVMLSIASSLSGLDLIQSLVGIISTPFFFASQENEWNNLFGRFIPRWLAVVDKTILTELYDGEATLYTSRNLWGWLFPVLAWSVFLCALLLVMLCLSVIVRKQWVEEEKLSYPIIQLPFAMTGKRSNFFLQHVMWMGFGLAVSINIVNGLHHLYPAIPSLGGELYEKTGKGLDLGRFFTEKPWSKTGSIPVMVIPSVVGLAFFIPLDLSFSFWFFFFFGKFQPVMAHITGLGELPRFPYIGEQAFGGLIGLCLISIWISRHHFKKVIFSLFPAGVVASIPSTDIQTDEAMGQYRLAFMGILFGIVVITLFCWQAGMSMGTVFIFFLLYFAISMAITRMRAELGAPVHDFHDSGLPEMIVTVFGTRRFGPENLTMFSFFRFFNRAYRPHPMPHQLEGFKIADRTRVKPSQLFVAITIATVVGTLAFFWAYLHVQYRFPGLNSRWRGMHTFSRLRSWLYYPLLPNYVAIGAMLIGCAFSLFLMMMRMRFLFWPFHPAGYVVATSFSVRGFWFSIFVGWLAKTIVLRLGGGKTHRILTPFFLGLILGEFVAGSFWSLLGIALEKPMYKFIW